MVRYLASWSEHTVKVTIFNFLLLLKQQKMGTRTFLKGWRIRPPLQYTETLSYWEVRVSQADFSQPRNSCLHIGIFLEFCSRIFSRILIFTGAAPRLVYKLQCMSVDLCVCWQRCMYRSPLCIVLIFGLILNLSWCLDSLSVQSENLLQICRIHRLRRFEF